MTKRATAQPYRRHEREKLIGRTWGHSVPRRPRGRRPGQGGQHGARLGRQGRGVLVRDDRANAVAGWTAPSIRRVERRGAPTKHAREVRPAGPSLNDTRAGAQPEQSTATARAAQMSRRRASASRPSLWTRMAIETLSIESRFTAERSGTGSSPGSSTTSLASPRMVVVHGATSARRCRGMTASRDSTTTGRRPISAISHHHTSPRAGTAVTTLPRPVETLPGPPTRLVHRAGARRRRRSSHPPRPNGSEPAER